jgi:hypothetical protein
VIRNIWSKLYGPTRNLFASFDRCLAVFATGLPMHWRSSSSRAPGRLALIHAPDSASGYPFAFGYITASRDIVDRIAYRIAELASRADGTKAVQWIRTGEDAQCARHDGRSTGDRYSMTSRADCSASLFPERQARGYACDRVAHLWVPACVSICLLQLVA